jgi:signal peptidase I
MDIKKTWKKVWKFIWYDDSILSWIVNIIIAFILIKFVVYPLLGLIFGTSFPIVAVVSESMQHNLYDDHLCGQEFDEFPRGFDNWWEICGPWYDDMGITKNEFRDYPFRNGFNKGDIMILWRANKENLEKGDVLVFWGPKPQPIIHRVVNVNVENEGLDNEQYFYHTKGDHNEDSFGGTLGETKISENRILGQGILRVPYLGWIKIGFVELMYKFGLTVA